MIARTREKSLPINIPKRKCRCGDCRNEIQGMTTCFRAGGRNVCESCGEKYRWNAAADQWELAPTPPKPRMGRPTLGESACEVRWFAKATHSEESLLVSLAGQFTGGNKSELLRLAVRRLAETHSNS